MDSKLSVCRFWPVEGLPEVNSPNLQNEDELAVFKKMRHLATKWQMLWRVCHPKGHVLLASFVSANNLQETDGSADYF